MKLQLLENDISLIKRGVLNNCIIFLPKMSDADYNRIKPFIEHLGTHWREKEQGFRYNISDGLMERRIEKLCEAREIVLSEYQLFQIKNQYYPTPHRLAREMVKLAKIEAGHKVLEPSAGSGRLLNEIIRYTDIENIQGIEIDESKAQTLHKCGYNIINTSFEDYYNNKKSNVEFDRVVMNPPFSEERDLRHTAMAFNLLKTGGILVGLVAENSLYYDREITRKFNSYLAEFDAQVIDVPYGTFEESGTLVDICIIVLEKKDESYRIDL